MTGTADLDRPPAALSGRVVLPADPNYYLLRSTYTTRHSPAVVVLATSPEDVRTALRCAADRQLKLAVRSGGHSLAGTSSNDGGLVIDLSPMNAVRIVDRSARLVSVQAGARWGTVARILMEHGLAISSGDHGNVGAGGLATAGGIGWMVRKFGLTIDRLRSATIVLANGEVLTVDATHHPELFWALRGAGGLIAIVTEFVFEAVEVTDIVLTQVEFHAAAAGKPLAQWDEYMRAAPRELTTTIVLLADPGGRDIGGVITAVYAGSDVRAAEQAIRPLLRLGPARQASTLQRVPYAALVSEAHLHPNVGQQRALTRNGMLDTLDAETESLVLAAAAKPRTMIQLRALGGAIGDVAADATAFGNRHQSALVIGTAWSAQDRAGLNQAWQALRPRFTGAYGNFESEPTPASIALAFPAHTQERLRTIKDRYDPERRFATWPE